jgi:hypothetical protein
MTTICQKATLSLRLSSVGCTVFRRRRTCSRQGSGSGSAMIRVSFLFSCLIRPRIQNTDPDTGGCNIEANVCENILKLGNYLNLFLFSHEKIINLLVIQNSYKLYKNKFLKIQPLFSNSLDPVQRLLTA